MKSKFSHSSVEIIEYPFEKVYLDELNEELIKNINLFNSSKNIKEKQNVINFIPIKFPICRFCGEKIINSNFYITYNTKQKYIQLSVPYIYCREIDHKKYLLAMEHCRKCKQIRFEKINQKRIDTRKNYIEGINDLQNMLRKKK